jgi:hypothetical protein
MHTNFHESKIGRARPLGAPRFGVQALACALALAWGGCATSDTAQKTHEQDNASLINASEVIIVAEIQSVDARRVSRDGPVITKARVLKVLKGDVREKDTLTFGQSPWGGWTKFKEEGARILFLQRSVKKSSADSPDYFVVRPKTRSNLDVIVERDSISVISLEEVQKFLQNMKLYKGPLREARP